MVAVGKAKDAARKMIAQANMDAEDKAKNSARMRTTRANKDVEIDQSNDIHKHAVNGIQVKTTKSVTEARRINQRTAVGEDEEGGGTGAHRAHVCVICNRFIIGTEKLCELTKEGIEKHRGRISVESFETYYGISLKPDLIKQYQIYNMPGLLLSPRYQRRNNTFDSCKNCANGMRPRRHGRMMLWCTIFIM